MLPSVIAGALSITATASAASFNVNDPTDAALASPSGTSCESTNGGSCTLRAAVQAADNLGGASTITLPAGTYTLTIPSTSADDPSNGDLDVTSGASITIAGAGSSATIINANRIDRAFAVQQSGSLSLSGLTIENGNPSSNSTQGPSYGGGIFDNGALSLTNDVTMRDNSSGLDGGAIFVEDGATALSISGSTFADNSALYGGAILLGTPGDTSAQSISGSTFVDNRGADEGGAVFDGGLLTLSADSFSGNDAGQGGAVYVVAQDDAAATVEHDDFEDNTATDGGGLFWYSGNLDVLDNTFAQNSVQDEGGAIYQDERTSGEPGELINNTLDGNSSYSGGAIADEAANAAWTIENNTIARNTAGQGGGIASPGQLGSGSTYANNIVADNNGGDCYAASHTITAGQDSGGNLDSDSTCFGSNGTDKPGVNPLLGPLQNNGGPLPTDELLPGSPAIGAAISALCPSTDERGVPRPAGACDSGAFQTGPAGLALSTTAPSSVDVGAPFTYTVTVTGTGPNPSTDVTVVDQLPAGSTLYGVNPSQGTCTTAGSPAKVTCDLLGLDSGAQATVTLLLTLNQLGTVTNNPIATDEQGASASVQATTSVIGVVAGGRKPKAQTGKHKRKGRHRAIVSGTISPGGQRTAYFFQYGTNRSYGQSTSVLYTDSTGTVSITLKGLRAGVTYHYRLVAINDSGVSKGHGKRLTG